jgi:type II restriction/modification system DNA methylase subunit YeeA
MTPAEFIKKWKPVALTERAAAHTHFLDLCKLFEHEDPVSADPTGDWFTFEKGATKTGGGEGFADVWKKNFFAWEYKKKKRDLNAAMDQLVRYAAALENPPLQVVCDTDRFIIRTAWTNAVPKQYEIELDDLALPEKREILWAVFHEPERLRPKETRANLTKEAADKFSTIALRLQGRGTAEEVAHFVNQLVFCFFANSVKLLPEGFFPKLLKRSGQRPDRALEYFNSLFEAMEHGGEFDLTDIAHFNGGLFDGRRAIRLDDGDIGLLVAAGSLDWSLIDPTIFGTLFERFLDPDKRAQIGAHYTDPDKIMMIVEPVILRPLRAEWETARAETERLVEAAHLKKGRAFDNAMTRAEEPRAKFLERLRKVTILDPACGSGNFLYLALQAVKDIELKANLECEALGLSPRVPVIGPEVVHGIEINPLAAELARTTIWIGDIQWRLRNGIYARPDPILRKLEAIECRDALVMKKQDGSFVEAQWPTAEFIVGNPPFLGASRMLGGLGENYTVELRRLYSERVPGFVDLVCYWFEKARDCVVSKGTQRVGLVATNSISGGENRVVLDKIAGALRIFLAYSDEKWTVEGADVRVAIIGFGVDLSEQQYLDGKPVTELNTDLQSGPKLISAARLGENKAVAFEGTKKYGDFEISGELARRWLLEPTNVNGRLNSDVLKPWLNGRDFSSRSSARWIIDFSGLSENDAIQFEAPYQYALEVVKPTRQSDRNAKTRSIWWRFERERIQLRLKLKEISRFITTTRHSKFRLFA